MVVINVTDAVTCLVARAAGADKSDDALKFSQAACNVANARGSLLANKEQSEKTTGAGS